MKKQVVPDYKAGQQSSDLSDMDIFGNKKLSSIFFLILIFVNVCSSGIVLYRNHYLSLFFVYLFLFCYILIILFIRKFHMSDSVYKQLYLDKAYDIFAPLFGLFIVYMMYVIWVQ